jgi:ABC-type multidrug transport system fused ATPase/permease subunit
MAAPDMTPTIQAADFDSINKDDNLNDSALDCQTRNEIDDLAQKVHVKHTIESGSSSPPLGAKLSHLDPTLPNFDARAWVKQFVSLTESDPKAAPLRALGVAFRNLSVFGRSNGMELQDTVLGIIASIASYCTNVMRGSRHGVHVDILRNFEGVVEKGEMLLVLGPPGSGCSTLLKTLAGETAGLSVDRDSRVNFRGAFKTISI